MGQRHQFYVIAKINGCHRLLAAAHHQWCYGDAAIAQCLRILEIFSAAGNLSGIQSDLRSALDIDWENDIWVDKSKNQACEFLFPFIATCLTSGSSVLFPLDTHFKYPVNDDGITIYDITEPQNPRYAFMFPFENVLMDALQYSERYEYEYADEEEFDEERFDEKKPRRPTTYECKANSPPDIRSCLDHRPVTVEAMYDVWPQWSQQEIKFHSDMQDVSASMVQDLRPTLKEQSLARLLDIAEESTDLDWLAEAESLPGFRTALRTKLYRDPRKLSSTPLGLELLARAFSGESTIDLSPFLLSYEQVQKVLRQAWEGTSPTFRSLSLPDIESLTTVNLKSIIDDFTPSKLILGITSRISLQEQLQTVQNTSVMDFISHAMYKRSLEMNSRYSHKPSTLPPAKFLDQQSQPQMVCQLVILKHFQPSWVEPAPRSPSGAIKWSELAPHADEWVYNEDRSTATVILPLRDAPISPNRISSLIPMLVSLSDIKSHDTISFFIGPFVEKIVKSFASADEDRRVRPLPAELMAEYYRFFQASCEAPLKRLELGSNQWTLLVTCETARNFDEVRGIGTSHSNAGDVGNAAESAADLDAPRAFDDMLAKLAHMDIAPEQQLRYSFIRRDQKGEVCILNATDFVRTALEGFEGHIPDSEASWKEGVKQLGRNISRPLVLRPCDPEEVHEALTYLDARDLRIDRFVELNKEAPEWWRESQLER